MKIAKTLLVASSAVAVLSLAACGKNEEQTAGQRLDSAVATTEQRAAEAREDMKDAAQDAKVAMQNTGEAIADKIDDATITAEVNAGLAKDDTLSALKINVDTHDGKVTLTGPAPTAAAKDRASDIARAVKGVSSVDNQLTVQPG